MGFETFAFVPRAKNAAKGTGIKVAMRLAPKVRTANFVIVISEEVAKKLKLESTNKFLVAFGNGDDTGKLRLTAADTKSAFACKYKTNRHGGWLEISLGEVPHLPKNSEAARWVDYDVLTTNEIVLKFPGWAFKAMTGTKEAEPDAPVPPALRATEVKQKLVERGLTKPPERPNMERIKALVPAPSSSGAQKPTRKEVLAQVGNLKGR